MKVIKNWNEVGEISRSEVFRFKNSERLFVDINTNPIGDYIEFLDLADYNTYTLDDLLLAGLKFYEDKKNEDFLGVEIVGHLTVVSAG